MSAPFISSVSENRSVDDQMSPVKSSYRHHQVSTWDSEHHAACLSDWDQTYSQLEAGAFSGELIDVGFSDIQVFRESTNRSVFQQGSPVDDCFVIGMPINMDGSGLFCGKQVRTQDLIAFNGH